jgi:hypothetical protein
MNHLRRIAISLLILSAFALSLSACGSNGPPPRETIISLLDEYHGEEGEYLWGAQVECIVPAGEDAVEEWDIAYTRTHIDGGSEERVKLVKNDAGEWSISDREGCMVR